MVFEQGRSAVASAEGIFADGNHGSCPRGQGRVAIPGELVQLVSLAASDLRRSHVSCAQASLGSLYARFCAVASRSLPFKREC